MNIRQRILLLISLSFAALIFTGGFAVFQNGNSSKEVKSVTEGVVPSTLKSVELMGQLKDVQIATLGMISAPDPQAVAQSHEEVKKKKAALQQALAEQMASAENDTQRGLIKQAEESLQNYFGSIDDTANFMLQGQKDMAEATMAATVDQYLREQISVIETIQVEKRRSKDEAIAKVNGNLRATTSTLSVVTLVAVLGMGAMGWLLYRQVIHPISDMQSKMSQIAVSQDFTHRVPVTRMDEIGKSVVAFNAMIEKIQHSSEEIRQKTADIHAMLHYIPQGILTLQSGGTIHPEYSEHLKTVLETQDIAGRDVMQVVFAGTGLGADALNQMEVAISACIGEDEMNFEFNSHLLPHEIHKTMADGRVKMLDLNWSPITDESGTTLRLLLCLRDVTEMRRLAQAAHAQGRELAIIGEILAVRQEKFQAFVRGTLQFLDDNAARIAQADAASADSRSDTMAVLFRNMHTIKGNARTYGLMHLTNVVHTAEETYDAIRQGRLPWDGQRLRAELDQTRAVVQEYAHISEAKLGRKAADPGAVADAPQRDPGSESIASMLSSVTDSLPALARELGKQPPRLHFETPGILLRTQLADSLRNVFMHLYRNAMDHGLESAAERLQAGKPETGTISLRLLLQGDTLVLRHSDDGRGLALQRIREKAVQKGLIAQDEQPSAHAVAQMVFASGFSTADTVTEISGRGVGMDAVKGFVQAEGGTISLELQDAAADAAFCPFETVIALPAKLAVAPLI